MKILLYNWVQFDDVERRGGGVRVYEQNLVNYLVRDTDHEVYTVASGLEQDFFDRRVRFEESETSHPGRVRSFVLLNSPVLAPGHHCFGTDKLFDEKALAVWHAFLREHGPFDVIQFDSLEGIPLNFLRIHEVGPQTRVLVYAHNYYAVCPQVNLWKNELTHCDDYHEGRDCVNCIPSLANPNEVLRAHKLSRLLRGLRITPGTRSYRLAYRLYARVKVNRLPFRLLRPALMAILGRTDAARPGGGGATQPADAMLASGDPSVTVTSVSLKQSSRFVERRTRSVDLINNEVDAMLATSHRVADVLSGYGIDRAKLEVAYIGTKVAENPAIEKRRQTLRRPGELTIAYLGYMRRDKGFYFLLDALERAPKDLLAKIRLVVAAGGHNDLLMERLTTIADYMADIEHYDGYTHEQLPAILDSVDVGVVPVQWEDNLPQVAIEMVAQGVPIITSHRGGAKEVGGNNEKFVFDASSRRQLLEIFASLLDDETKLNEYWDHAMDLVTMDRHFVRLMELYKTPATA